MKSADLLLRCYANRKDGQWQAFCIDFSLAAQGDSFPDVRTKLETMIAEYIYDALAGEDREYADQLLHRKAPLRQIATYYYYALMYKIGAFGDGLHQLFKPAVPLVPQAYARE
ncbi:MAG: hypothetical protein L0H15_00695 [Nitrosospira sp.]|nr:hypothetical protein [Nitrosospira sp.]MDN5935101.1 hypothetical protein [Nitrosospira sp.]